MKIFITKSKIIFISLALVVSSFVNLLPHSTKPALAVDCDESFYSDNDILFYSPMGCDTTCANVPTTGVIGFGSLPIETTSYLEDTVSIKTKIDANKARYLAAEAATGIKWQAIAALHFREGSLDSGKSILNGTTLGSGVDEASGQTVPSDPGEDATLAAKRFSELAISTYQIDPSTLKNSSSGAEWGRAFLAYHAGPTFQEVAKDYTDSTYVVNGIDQNKLNMSWIGGTLESESGTDPQKAGALTVFKYLGGIDDASGCAGYGAVAGNIVQTGINFALSTPATEGVMIKNTDAKQSYIEAYTTLNGRLPTEYPAGSSLKNEVTDCGRFVSVVMRSSGADTSFPEAGTVNMDPYLKGSSKYIEVTAQELKPGDIMIYAPRSVGTSGHIMIYTGVNGDYLAVDASLGGRVPSVRSASSVEWMKSQSGYSAWRLNG